jgi:hypothetical protein
MDAPDPFVAPQGPSDPVEELPEGASWRVILIQAAAFLLYQAPASWLVAIADPDLAAPVWLIGLVGGAFLWGQGHRRRGLTERGDLRRSLQLVVAVQALFYGLPILGATMSPQEDALPFVGVAVQWLIASFGGLALGMSVARPADPPRVADDRPPSPRRDAFDPILGRQEAELPLVRIVERARVRRIDTDEPGRSTRDRDGPDLT